MSNLKVRLTPQENLLITNYRVFQGSTVKLGQIFDVNTQGAVTGSMLMYNEETTEWSAQTEIKEDTVSIDGGEF
jgi:hypothetical protein